MTIDKTMTNEEYHAHPAISSSDVKAVASTSLLHWRNKVYKTSSAFDLGTAVHAMVLERDLNLVARGPETRRGKQWTEAKAAADLTGQLLLTEGDYDVAEAMAESLLATDIGRRMADESTMNEVSFFATDPDIGIDLKTRPYSYWPDRGMIYDIKTTQTASPAGFAREVVKYNYALQAAFYLHVLKLGGHKAENFVFACVEKQPPYAVGVHVLTHEYIDWARGQMMVTLDQIKRAQDSGTFTTGWPEVNVIDLPRWLHDAPDDEDFE